MDQISISNQVWAVALLLLTGKILRLAYETYHVKASPDHWLLVIRDGNAIVQQIGGQGLLRPGDRAIQFPSLLRKVDFAAN